MTIDRKNDSIYTGFKVWEDLSTPNINPEYLVLPAHEKLGLSEADLTEAPKFLLLYGSCREVSYSRLLVEEAARILISLGAEVKIFDPRELPLPGPGTDDHPKCQELMELALWADGHVWSSPERHGNISAVLKNQIDHIPLAKGSVRPTQGRTLAVMQVCGGSQSFNSVNSLRVLGRWMRMLVVPNQSSVPRAYTEFDEYGRMKDSPLYDRVVDVMEELVKFTLLTRGKKDYLVDRYSERRAAHLPPANPTR
jgi:arsenic resistance protein ArsH